MLAPIRPYSGIRIIDTTYQLGRYATRLFADLGAEVIRVEPPGGLPDRRHDTDSIPGGAAAFAFHNASKQSLVLDFSSNAGRAALAELVRSAQVVAMEAGGPLGPADFAWLAELNAGAVLCFVSPYGLDGPLTDAPACDLTLQAAGGIAWMSGRAGEPPLRLPAGQAAMVASVYAAVATALSLFDAEARGRGHLLDVSAQECIAHSLQNTIQVWDLERRVSRRAGEGTRDASENIFACRDGHVFLASTPQTGTTWKALVGWMRETGHPSAEAFAQPKWLDQGFRVTPAAHAEFRPLFESFSQVFTRRELLENALERRIVMAPVARLRDVLGDRQLDWRGFFGRTDDAAERFPGAPYRLSEPVWAAAPAPALDSARPYQDAGSTP